MMRLPPGRILDLERSPDCPPGAWMVTEGTLDLFVDLETDDSNAALREYLFTAGSGEAVPDFPDVPGIRLLAAGTSSTELTRIGEDALERLAVDGAADLAGGADFWLAIDAWLRSLSSALARFAPAIDFVDQQMHPASRVRLAPGERVASAGGIVWARLEGGERLSYLDCLEVGDGVALLPLSRDTWLTAGAPSTLSAAPTAVLGTGVLKNLERFHALALVLLRGSLDTTHRDEEERLAAKERLVGSDRREVLARFSAVIDPQEHARLDALPPLAAACRRIGDLLGVRAAPPDLFDQRPRSARAQIDEFSRRSRLRARQVVLRDRWWRRETRPMLAFFRDTEEPVVLFAGRGRRRTCWIPGTDPNQTPVVTAELAARIDPIAWSFYRTLPDRPQSAPDLLRFALRLAHKDLFRTLLYGVLGTLMSMLVPIATGVIIDSSIPSHQRRQLVSIALGLVVAALAVLAFKICEGIALLRIEGKVAEALEPALLDRLLRMPNRFFRRYSAGDLAERMKSVEQIQSRLAGGVMSALLAGAFSLLNFAIMFFWQARAAGVAALLLGIMVVVLLFVGRRQRRFWAKIHRLEGELASAVLQMVNGMQRIRLTGAEDRMFVRWGNLSMEFRETLTRCFDTEVLFNAWLKGYQILCFAVVFATVARLRDDSLTTGGFLAFLAAFTLTLNGLMQLARHVLQAVEIVPMYRRMEPILEEVPESEADPAHPGVLSGELEVNEVVFRYGDGSPQVLKGLSFSVHAGQSVAIVGESGCGKSTLFRLILGFEQPTSGSIYFDGKDLAGLDLREVRHQIGVVLQNDALMDGTIFENIRGDSDISMEEAWQAARMCGIAGDILAMPLGMHTVISALGADLSGGQVQRLLIARALAARPRVLLLDEATSALDNRSQSVVTDSLDRLRVTRIAIAHRLSTVRNADRIIVIEDGRVAESGTYDELMRRAGAFAGLVRRQLQ